MLQEKPKGTISTSLKEVNISIPDFMECIIEVEEKYYPKDNLIKAKLDRPFVLLPGQSCSIYTGIETIICPDNNVFYISPTAEAISRGLMAYFKPMKNRHCFVELVNISSDETIIKDEDLIAELFLIRHQNFYLKNI